MTIPDWIFKAAAEGDTKPLTDAMMKEMIPLFVEKEKYPDDDHKCGNCNMRVEGDTSTCTVVNQNISLTNGICSYWAGGDAASPDKIHEERMSPETSLYGEYDGKVNCGTCYHFKKEPPDYCALWMGTADPSECCTAWGNHNEKGVEGKPDLKGGE